MKKYKEKQPTYLVTVKDEKEKRKIVESNLALIRDWKMGWFDVPLSMYEEFKKQFGIRGLEHSVCGLNITKQEIHIYNTSRC